MKIFIERRLIGVHNIFFLLWLILVTASCQGEALSIITQKPIKEQLKQEANHSNIYETILFCGNPGVGKSSLCNSIFMEHVFESGTSFGGGMTQEQKEHIYENRTYIDTPGLADINRRKEAAKEIEAALKKDNNYKVIFVITLEAGRFRGEDFATINTICEAITVPFECGIIINKVSDLVLEEINKQGGIQEAFKPYLGFLKKNISLSNVLIIKKDSKMEDVENVRLTDSEERKKLVNFISEIEGNYIKSEEVNVDVTDYKAKVEEMERELHKLEKRSVAVLNLHKGISSKILGVGKKAVMLAGPLLVAVVCNKYYLAGQGIPIETVTSKAFVAPTNQVIEAVTRQAVEAVTNQAFAFSNQVMECLNNIS